MKRKNNESRRRELAKNLGGSLSEVLINPYELIDGNHRIYGLYAVQKKRQATKSVARLDNPRQTNVSAKEQL